VPAVQHDGVARRAAPAIALIAVALLRAGPIVPSAFGHARFCHAGRSLAIQVKFD